MIKKNRWNLMALCCLAALIGLSGCQNGAGTAETAEKPSSEVVQEAEEENTSENAQPTPENETDMVISTEYGDLHFRDQWREFMDIRQEQTEDVVTVYFNAMINETEYNLFEIRIGGEEGTQIGSLTDNSGNTHNVYAVVEELSRDENLTEEEQSRLYAMQEDINYLIGYLN